MTQLLWPALSVSFMFVCKFYGFSKTLQEQLRTAPHPCSSHWFCWEVFSKGFLKVRLQLLNLIISSCSPKAVDPPCIVPTTPFHIKPEAHKLWIILHQVRCLSLIFRPKTRGSDSSCHHTCSPAALYSGQWCFVSRSRSNASHQTIWTRASNWTSKVSTIFSAGPCQPVFSVLNMQDWPGAFHGPLSFF